MRGKLQLQCDILYRMDTQAQVWLHFWSFPASSHNLFQQKYIYPDSETFFAVYRNSLVTRMNASSAKKWHIRTNIPSTLLERAAKERTLSKNIQNVITKKKRSKLSMRRLILFGFKLHVNSPPLGKSHVRDTPLISDRDWDYCPLENTLQTTGIRVKKSHFTKESRVKGKGGSV